MSLFNGDEKRKKKPFLFLRNGRHTSAQLAWGYVTCLTALNRKCKISFIIKTSFSFRTNRSKDAKIQKRVSNTC